MKQFQLESQGRNLLIQIFPIITQDHKYFLETVQIGRSEQKRFDLNIPITRQPGNDC